MASKEEAREKQRLVMAFASLCVANFLCALDATSIGVLLPTIASDLDGTTLKALWTGTSFLLASTVCQPIYTSLSQTFGRKSPLLVALTLFMVGSIVCAVAGNFPVLLTGRTFQGLGVGGIMTLTFVIVSDLVPLDRRGNWFGIVMMTVAIGTVVGPLIGGSLARAKLWRYLFWINVPVCVTAHVAILFCLRLKKVEGSVRQKLLRVDWMGSVHFMASLTITLVPLSWGGIMFAWTAWQVILPVMVGILGFTLFMVWSTQSGKEAILPKTMFKLPTALASYFGATVFGMVLWCSLFYMPLYFQAVRGYSPLMAGVAQLPYSVTYGPLSAFIGFMISKKGSYRWALHLGWIVLLTGVAHLLILDQTTAVSSWIPLEGLVGVGLGILSGAVIFAVQASASPADVPHAAGVYVFFRALGQVVGMVISGAVFQNALRIKLASYPLLEATDASAFANDALSMVEYIKLMPVSQERQDVIECLVFAFRMVWYTTVGCVCVAAVLALIFTKDYPLKRVDPVDPDGVSIAAPPSLPDIERMGPMTFDHPLDYRSQSDGKALIRAYNTDRPAPIAPIPSIPPTTPTTPTSLATTIRATSPNRPLKPMEEEIPSPISAASSSPRSFTDSVGSHKQDRMGELLRALKARLATLERRRSCARERRRESDEGTQAHRSDKEGP